MSIKRPKWVKLWLENYARVIDPVFVLEEFTPEEQKELYADLGKAFFNIVLLSEYDFKMDSCKDLFISLDTRTGQRTQKDLLKNVQESISEYAEYSEKGKKGAAVRWGDSEQKTSEQKTETDLGNINGLNLMSKDELEDLKFLLQDYGKISFIDDDTVLTTSGKKFKWREVFQNYDSCIEHRKIYNPEDDAF